MVIAGGPKMKTEREVLEMVYGAVQAGASGLSVGRNIFQARDRVKMVRALNLIVHEGKGVQEALKILD